MKKSTILLIIFLLIAAGNINAQTSNSQSSSTSICSIVKEGDGGRVSKKAPLILHMYDSSIKKNIEIVFTRSMRSKMSYDPYDKLVNQSVCITGNLTSYNKKPAIIIKSEEQIKKQQ